MLDEVSERRKRSWREALELEREDRLEQPPGDAALKDELGIAHKQSSAPRSSHVRSAPGPATVAFTAGVKDGLRPVPDVLEPCECCPHPLGSGIDADGGGETNHVRDASTAGKNWVTRRG